MISLTPIRLAGGAPGHAERLSRMCQLGDTLCILVLWSTERPVPRPGCQRGCPVDRIRGRSQLYPSLLIRRVQKNGSSVPRHDDALYFSDESRLSTSNNNRDTFTIVVTLAACVPSAQCFAKRQDNITIDHSVPEANCDPRRRIV